MSDFFISIDIDFYYLVSNVKMKLQAPKKK